MPNKVKIHIDLFVFVLFKEENISCKSLLQNS